MPPSSVIGRVRAPSVEGNAHETPYRPDPRRHDRAHDRAGGRARREQEPVRRHDPDDGVRHPAHHGEGLRRRSATATATPSAQETICTLADTYTTVRARAVALLRPGRGLRLPRQRLHGQQPQQRLLLPADHRRPPGREAARASRPGRAQEGDPAGRDRLRRRLQPLAQGRRWRARASPTRPARARPGSSRSPRSMPTGASTSWRCSPAAASRSTASARAQPPTPGAPAAALPEPAAIAEGLKRRVQGPGDRLQRGRARLGRRPPTGAGMLLGNPHFPWLGSERFFQSHLTIPGKVDVAGGSLLGVPIILIGHTAHQAWSHTGQHGVPVHAVPGDARPGPADDLPRTTASRRAMTSRTMTVKSLEGGKLVDRTRTLWSTRHGSVFTSLLGHPAAVDCRPPPSSWATPTRRTSATSTTSSRSTSRRARREDAGDPQAQPGHPVGQHDRGRRQGRRALRRHLRDAARHERQGASPAVRRSGHATFAALRLPVLDGSRSTCEWGSRPRRRCSRAPSARRTCRR